MSDLRSGRGGIPDWLEPMVRFCSRCGGVLAFGPLEDEERERLACPKCGLVCYVNPRLVVTTLPVTENGEVMLIRRGIAPGIGQWAQPGGFLEIDETVRDAAIRETLEETGLLVEPGAIVGLYSGVPAAVVVVAFEARVVGGTQRTTREALETLAFAPDAIPWDKIAFETSVRALRDWVARVRPDLPLPDPSTLNRPFGG
jgi:ADP-ribose pyrophosphatase YjhB (NUDIX family)